MGTNLILTKSNWNKKNAIILLSFKINRLDIECDNQK